MFVDSNEASEVFSVEVTTKNFEFVEWEIE